MLRLALRQHDRREAMGQIIRVVVGGPGSLVGKYPPGNTGQTSMGLTETAPLPPDMDGALGRHTTPR